jgi:DNA-binding transcriptional MerR regulator
MQISELASLSGVSVHAIRHYESLGLIAASRRPSGYREFDDSVIRELRFIAMSRQCGFSLAQIAEVLPAYRCKSLTASQIVCRLEERIAEIDAEIASATLCVSTWFPMWNGFVCASSASLETGISSRLRAAAMMPVHPAGGSKS